MKLKTLFQSTPPVKAATEIKRQEYPVFEISIHAAREGGDAKYSRHHAPDMISIHAAREGGDNEGIYRIHPNGYFNPRRP